MPQGTTFGMYFILVDKKNTHLISLLVNGTVEQKLDRLAIREICEGWPTHRDAQEWPRVRHIYDQ